MNLSEYSGCAVRPVPTKWFSRDIGYLVLAYASCFRWFAPELFPRYYQNWAVHAISAGFSS